MLRTALATIAGVLLAVGVIGIALVCGSVVVCWRWMKDQIVIEDEPQRIWWT